MHYSYRILSTDRPVVLVRLNGPFDLELSISTLAAVGFVAREHAWKGLIWDARRRTDYPNSAEVRELVSHFRRWDRVAVVTGPDVQYGMGRMASLLSDRVMAVRSLREGLSWAAGDS